MKVTGIESKRKRKKEVALVESVITLREQISRLDQPHPE